MVEAVEKNFVLAKKAPRGFSGFTYQCLKCNVDFTTRIICIRHASTCGKAFTGKKRGKNTRRLTCNLGTFKSTTEGALAMHRSVAHKEATSQRVRCLTCNDTFASVKILKKHILVVHKNCGQVKCNVCGKKFANKFNLGRHKDTHLRDDSQRARDRLSFREVALSQWDGELGDVGVNVEGVNVEGVNFESGEVDQDGSDVEDDPAASGDHRQGFSLNELGECFIEQCRKNGDSEKVLRERRKALEARFLKKVSPSTSSPPSSTPSTSGTAQVDL